MSTRLEDWAQPIKEQNEFAEQLKSMLSAGSNESDNQANSVTTKMPVYIGTKIVCAKPMAEILFLTTVKKQDMGQNAREDAPGYLVVYEDGYKSWSPKEVFERSYRQITDAEKKLIY